jgi:hypothetical protein
MERLVQVQESAVAMYVNEVAIGNLASAIRAVGQIRIKNPQNASEMTKTTFGTLLLEKLQYLVWHKKDDGFVYGGDALYEFMCGRKDLVRQKVLHRDQLGIFRTFDRLLTQKQRDWIEANLKPYAIGNEAPETSDSMVPPTAEMDALTNKGNATKRQEKKDAAAQVQKGILGNICV